MKEFHLKQSSISEEVEESMETRKEFYGVLRQCQKCQKECKQFGGANLIKFECYDFIKC